MKVKVGSFTTGTLNPNDTISITGVGFQPKAVLFMVADPDAIGSTDVDARNTSIRWGFGFAANSEDSCIGVFHGDSLSNNQATDIEKTRSVSYPMTNAGADEMFITTYGSDGFTLKTTGSWTKSVVVAYMALGGVGVLADLYLQPNRAVGQTSETPFSFDPDFLFSLMSVLYRGAANLFGLGISLGAADDAGDYVAASFAKNDINDNSFGGNYIYSGEMWAEPSGGVSTAGRDRLVNFITNGYKHEVLEALAGWQAVHVLGIKTGGVTVGDFLTQTSTGQFSVTGIGFKPVGLILVSLCRAVSTQDTPETDDAKMSVGFTDGTTERCTGYNAEDSTNPPRSTCFYQKDGIYFNNGSVASGFVGIANFISFDTDGFTLDMTDADPAQSFVWYVAFGPEAGGFRGRVMILRTALRSVFERFRWRLGNLRNKWSSRDQEEIEWREDYAGI